MVLTFSVLSCEKFIGGDLNADPNKPLSVPITGLTGQVQISLADVYGSSFSRWNSMFVQQVEGVARQWTSFNQYQIQSIRFDDSWSDTYENIINELGVMTRIAEENEYNHYLGLCKVVEAYTIMMMTDVWGDIPYTEAGQGATNFNPVFEDQATVIYPAILTLLNEAKTLFDGPAGGIAPGSEDLYYGGDIDAWQKAINAIKARYYLHLKNYPMALASAQASFTSRADNMAYQYGSDPASGGWYRFNNGREGDIEFHPTMRRIMKGLKDSDRLSVIDKTFTINGTPHPYFIAAFRQDLISYREIQFIIAEAALNTNTATATAAYLKGIQASFEEFGFSATGTEYTTYVAQAEVDPEDNFDMERIMTQKYIAMFAQPEVWSDWRRTKIPELVPVSGAIPLNWDYGQQTYFFNSSAPESILAPASLLKGVDWLSNWEN